MKKPIVLIVTGVVISLSASAQNDIDAMRYSQLTFGGTARFASMAGSMSAIGGDISCLSLNPAGIAVFRKTEISFTPSFYTQSTSSTFNGMNSSDRKLNFNFGNIGIVASFLTKAENTSGWKSVNFGIGYNRTNNFYNRISIQGMNKTSSLLDTYVAAANGHDYSNFDGFSTNLAYQCWLINPDTSGNLTYNHVIPHYGEQQRKSVESKGAMGETVISFGGNYKDKLLLGGTLGIVNARYEEESVYEETDTEDTITGFKSFKYTQSLSSACNLGSGKGGINLKLGVIVKPTDWLRIGAAIHTPSSLAFKDSYSSTMHADLDGVVYDTVSPKGEFDYTVTTPFRAIGSLGFVINKIGLINAEYEYIDYTYAQLNSHPNVFADVNSTIRTKYTSTGNLRVGGELRLDPISIRLGYALYGSPYKTGDNKNANRMSYTGGVGFRQDNYFIDLAYVFSKYAENSYLYDSKILSPVKNDIKNSSVMLTLGVRF